MQRAQKEQVVEELSQVFQGNTGVLLLDFTGINVADETELRRKMTESGSGYRVVKNSLAKRAAQGSPLAQLDAHFSGPTAVAFTAENPVALAKALTAFLKAHPSMSLKGGVLEDSVLSVEDVQALADLPSREELLAKLTHQLLAPLTKLASALQTPLRNLASVLNQLQDKKQSQG